MSALTSLAASLREARKLEKKHKVILLDTAASSGLDVRSGHTIVCHAENTAIRTAQIDTYLRSIEARCPRGSGRLEQVRFSLEVPTATPGVDPIAFVLETARRFQIIYRLLCALSWQAQEAVICEAFNAMASQERIFMLMLGGKRPNAGPQDDFTLMSSSCSGACASS